MYARGSLPKTKSIFTSILLITIEDAMKPRGYFNLHIPIIYIKTVLLIIKILISWNLGIILYFLVIYMVG